MSRPTTGDPVPEFEMAADDGRIVSPASQAGSRYVLCFYPKDDTPGRTAQACGLRDSWSRITETGVEVFGVSLVGTERSTFVIGLDATIEHVLARVEPDAHVDQLMELLAA